MKTPLWFPQSFFSRTLWLVLIVVLFSKALTLVYLLMNEDVLVDRQYSHGVALTLRAYWAADEENRNKIIDAVDLVRVVGGGVPEGEQHWPTVKSTNVRCRLSLGLIPKFACGCTRLLRCGCVPRAWVKAG